MRYLTIASALLGAVSMASAATWGLTFSTDTTCGSDTERDGFGDDHGWDCTNLDSLVDLNSVHFTQDGTGNPFTAYAFTGENCKGNDFALQDNECLDSHTAKGSFKSFVIAEICLGPASGGTGC